MRFLAKLGNVIIGRSELESGDPPMGVAGGRFFPTPAYASIQAYCIEHRDAWEPIADLKVEEKDGVLIECSGPIQIIDFSAELGESGIEIHLHGVTKPPYAELFPQHLQAYSEQFKPKS